ncbi:hypothetical protein AB2N08_08095 [Massilia aurea]|uniref:DUF6916 family protein n=1 Tax=Massilia aurea TaxID=373040 RepID=UPI0034618852
MKRRHLLQLAGGSLALAGAGMATATVTDQPVPVELPPDTLRWSRARAEALVGQGFWLNHPDTGAVTITLKRVDVMKLKTPDPRLDQFSLVFHGPLNLTLTEGSFDLDHAALGRFALHLSPAGRDGGHAVCRSDFSLVM